MKSEIKNSLAVLEESGLLLYPTDTVWGIDCDATDENAVKRIYKLKQRADSKSLISLIDGIPMLKKYVSEIPSRVFEILKTTERPTTIIYRNPTGFASGLLAEDNSIGIRITHHPFCKELIRQFGKPLVSSSANQSGHPTPEIFSEIEPVILNGVDYIVNLQRNKKSGKPSVIIRVHSDGSTEVIRE